jgi:ribosome-associated translation inhibitor RaiA
MGVYWSHLEDSAIAGFNLKTSTHQLVSFSLRNRIVSSPASDVHGGAPRVPMRPLQAKETDIVDSAGEQRDTFGENVLHVGAGFKANEHPHILETLSTLGPHLLGRWDAKDIDVEVSLQDRGGKEQRVTLRTSLPGRPPLIAVAENPDITHALTEAKRELIRQLEHQKSGNNPMGGRRRNSATIRH